MNEIEKRVRRHVRAKEHGFFAVCQPGFENDCAEEIRRISGKDCFVTEGGCAFRGKMDTLYRASVHSRCTTRFLMRIARFRADNFDYFKRCFSQIPWELFISPDCSVSFSVSCKKSKLMHSGRIEQDAREVLEPSFSGTGITQTIFIRFFHDICTVSLDASGEALYRRSERTLISRAPLRETIASLILEHAHLNEYEALIDPMGGSGVFTIEAYQRIHARTAQLSREFPFFAWPVFSENMFRHCSQPTHTGSSEMSFHVSDIDQNNINIMRQNFANASIQCEPRLIDFFELENPFPLKKSLLVLNPPYGKRITVQDTAGFYRSIFDHLREKFSACSFAIIIPEEIYQSVHNSINISDSIRFHNGNIHTRVVFGVI